MDRKKFRKNLYRHLTSNLVKSKTSKIDDRNLIKRLQRTKNNFLEKSIHYAAHRNEKSIKLQKQQHHK